MGYSGRQIQEKVSLLEITVYFKGRQAHVDSKHTIVPSHLLLIFIQNADFDL